MPKTIKELVKVIEALTDKVSILEAKLSPKGEEQSIVHADNFVKGEVISPRTEPKFPIPAEYVNLVNTILNNKFGISIEPQGDRPSFLLVITVPKDYSPLSASDWEYAKGDIRPKMIGYGDGVAGVKTYLELVWNTFNPDVQAQIAKDRI